METLFFSVKHGGKLAKGIGPVGMQEDMVQEEMTGRSGEVLFIEHNPKVPECPIIFVFADEFRDLHKDASVQALHWSVLQHRRGLKTQAYVRTDR